MHWDLILWLIAFVCNIALLCMILYQIICLSDLEADYMNPYESSKKINSLVVPEFILQGVFCAMFLLTGHRFMFLVTLPVAAYDARVYLRGAHLLDVTEIFRAISHEKKCRIIKLAVHLIFFFLVILRSWMEVGRRKLAIVKVMTSVVYISSVNTSHPVASNNERHAGL